MKLTESHLRKMIKEEIKKVLVLKEMHNYEIEDEEYFDALEPTRERYGNNLDLEDRFFIRGDAARKLDKQYSGKSPIEIAASLNLDFRDPEIIDAIESLQEHPLLKKY